VSVSDTEDFIEETARHLAEGKIVGWFQGGSEFGPRALGNRSILADPRKPEMRRTINSLIKFREDFRPFAPSVIAEEVGRYFDCAYESPHMILVAPVRPEWKEAIPSVVHQDQSCRIQTVTQAANPTYYRLLQAFKARTGIGVLLNTSFNRRGMPIVETPEQALGFYLACDLDVLVLSDRVMSKARKRTAADLNLAKFFNQDLRQALERNWQEARLIGGVYQVCINSVQTWTIDLTSNQPMVSEGALKMRPSTVVHLAEADFQKYQANPEAEALNLLQTGRLKINGDQEQLMKVSRIFRMTE
jgi:carbamoyltransferase